MKYDPEKHHRRSIRLKDYDYSKAGAYYVTINVQNRECLFGYVVNGEMVLNDSGIMIDEQWNALTTRFPNIELDVYQIMPNHFHAIVVSVGASLVDAPVLLGDIIGAFKSITTNEYIEGVKNRNWSRFFKRLWQRNYYEHVVRDEADLIRIRNYIQLNPVNWDKDQENPLGKKGRDKPCP